MQYAPANVGCLELELHELGQGDEIQQRVMAADANQIDSASWEEARDELIAELMDPRAMSTTPRGGATKIATRREAG